MCITQTYEEPVVSTAKVMVLTCAIGFNLSAGAFVDEVAGETNCAG